MLHDDDFLDCGISEKRCLDLKLKEAATKEDHWYSVTQLMGDHFNIIVYK